MSFSIADDVHFCLVGGRAVFLNLSSGRYVTLPKRLNTAFGLYLAGSTTSDVAAGTLAPLVDAGLLSPGSRIPTSTPCITPATRQFPVPNTRRFRTMLTCEAIACFLVARLMLRTVSLKSIVLWMRRRKPTCSRPGDADYSLLADCLRSAAASDTCLSPVDRCLPKALALALMLWRRGLAADIIFGVRTSPFAAHCWVQFDGYVLHDTVDRVALFTPILAI